MHSFFGLLKGKLNSEVHFNLLPWRQIGYVSLFSFLVLFNLGVFGYGAYSRVYNSRFLPGTVVAGIQVGGKSYQEAENLLANRLNKINYKPVQIQIGEHSYAPVLNEIGVSLNWQDALIKTYHKEKEGNFIQQFLVFRQSYQEGIRSAASSITDEKKFDEFINYVASSSTEKPEDALIQESNGQFVIKEEVLGTEINKDELAKAVSNGIRKNLESGVWKNIVYEAHAVAPSVSRIDLADAKGQAENLAKNPFTFTWEDKVYQATSKDISKWIKFGAVNNIYQAQVDRKAVANYVASLAKKTDLKAKDKLISSKDEKVLQEGADGRKLDQTAVVNAIISKITAGEERVVALQVAVVAFTTKKVFPAFTPGLYEGKYIETNLSTQRMYLWDGTNLVKEYRVSTGKPSTPTRQGTFNIKNKASVGKSYPWIMPWWMAFAPDSTGAWQGIHELPVDMRTGLKEGIRDIGYAVSHGCIRLAVGDAQEVYNWAEVGMPLYIHK